MKTAKLFWNGNNQAVSLPKEFRFDGSEVFIKRVGSAVVLLPRGRSWDTLVESLAKSPPTSWKRASSGEGQSSKGHDQLSVETWG